MKRFQEIREGDMVGGKALRLAKLSSLGFPVKNGVIVGLEEVEKIIDERRVPERIIEDIQRLLDFGTHGVAVRSAAIGEDGALSWPGQFKSRLFVHQDALAEAILECADAQKSEVVKAYARMHNVEIPPLTLIIQEMVDAEVAGVLFTTNPVNGNEEMVVEAILGVSDSLVSGSRQPVRYYLNPNTQEIIRKEGDEKEILLSHEKLYQLVSIAKEVYKLFGLHQDIEWAVERNSGKIFLNQARDITALVEKDVEDICERAIQEIKSLTISEKLRLQKLGVGIKGENVLSDQNIAELLTPFPCQMAFGLFTYEFAHGDGAIRKARNEIGYNIGRELDTGFFNLVGGQPRCSIIHDAFTYRIKGIPLDRYCRIIDHYLEKISENKNLANYPEVVLYEQNPSIDFLRGLFSEKEAQSYFDAYQKFFANIRLLEDDLEKACREEFIPRWGKKITAYQEIATPKTVRMLVYHFNELCDLLRIEACPMFVKTARLGFFAYARLRQLLVELFGADAESHSNVLTSGISPELNINLRFSIQLAALREGKVSTQAVIAEFGHLAEHELEISFPRYSEQPDFIQELANKISVNPLQNFEESSMENSKLKQRLMKVAGGKSEELEREIQMARTYLPLREVVKFEFLKAYALLRNTAVQIEERLGWEQGLIFHLDPREVFVIAERSAALHEIAKERQRMQRAYQAVYVPTIIGTGRLEQIGSIPEEMAGVLKGIGVTNVVAEGIVVVVTSLDDKKALGQLQPGSILVTVTTDPAWSPLLSIVGRKGGLITEIGGLLAHGAIYAREVGMAAVLNVPNATRLLQTGMKVRVNGPQGYIEIL